LLKGYLAAMLEDARPGVPKKLRERDFFNKLEKESRRKKRRAETQE